MRAEAKDALYVALDKRAGKGLGRTLPETQLVPVERLSTGSVGLDWALGGGLPMGRVVESFGGESGGKCLGAGTHLLTEHGLITVAELFELHGFAATNTERVLPQAARLLNGDGVLETTSHFTWNALRPVYRIRTRRGFTLEVTARHPIRVMDATGYIGWRTAESLKVDDTVVVGRGAEVFGTDPLTEDEARFLGYLIADGHIATGFSNSDPEVEAWYRDFVVRTFDVTPARYNKAFRERLYREYGLDYVLSAGKTVPLRVRCATRATQVAFLRAYFELESAIGERNIEVASASRVLLEQVQLMLLNLGIVSGIGTKPVNGVEYYRMHVSGEDANRYLDVVGYATTARQQMLAKFSRESRKGTRVPHMAPLLRSLHSASESTRETNRLVADTVRGVCDITYGRLQACVDHFSRTVTGPMTTQVTYLQELINQNYFYDQIDSIEYNAEGVPTFDVVMPETHSFWTSGLVSHNTSLSLMMMGAIQRQGGSVAYVDAEHSFDARWAAKQGVNTNTMYYLSPTHGEHGLTAVEEYARSGAVDLVVVDSVAALIPLAELEGKMGDAHVGRQARMMGQHLRRLGDAANNSKCTVLFINQIREKVGVMFGNPETTPGGRALKFWASVRLDVRRGTPIKAGDVVIGHSAKIKVIKNKTATPFLKLELPLMIGRGFDTVREMVNLGIIAGIIEKDGGSYVYAGEKMGRGLEQAVEWAREREAKLITELRPQLVTFLDTGALQIDEPDESAVPD